MRPLLLIFVAIFISLTGADDKEGLHKAQEECKEESELDQEKFENIRKTATLNESDEAEMDFMKCLGIKLFLMKEDGSLNKENVMEYYKKNGENEYTINEAIEACDFKEKPNDLGVLSYRYYLCFHKFFPENAELLLKN